MYNFDPKKIHTEKIYRTFIPLRLRSPDKCPDECRWLTDDVDRSWAIPTKSTCVCSRWLVGWSHRSSSASSSAGCSRRRRFRCIDTVLRGVGERCGDALGDDWLARKRECPKFLGVRFGCRRLAASSATTRLKSAASPIDLFAASVIRAACINSSTVPGYCWMTCFKSCCFKPRWIAYLNMSPVTPTVLLTVTYTTTVSERRQG